MEDKGRRHQQQIRGPAVEPAADEGIDFDIINDTRLEEDADSTYRPNIKPTDAIPLRLLRLRLSTKLV
jgi:hypothetical protein